MKRSSNAAMVPPERNTSSAEVETDTTGAIVIRIHAAPQAQAGSPLVAFPFGLEAEAARRVMRDGLLPVAKIGRTYYARREDVAALVDKLAASSPRPKPVKVGVADPASALASIANAERRRGAR